jgi:PAS domain S-box-containing protein
MTVAELIPALGSVERLVLEGHEFGVAEDPSVRRQSALSMLAKFAQETTNTRQLFVEAAVLAARTLEADHFVATHCQPESSTYVVLSGSRPTSLSAVEVLETTFDRADRHCLLARAVDATEPLIIDNLAAEQRSKDPLLANLNAQSALFCPIRYANHEYGAIGVLSTDRNPAAQADILFLESLSLLLGPNVAYQRTESVLAQRSALLDATIDALDSLVLVLSPDGKIVRLNQACEEVTGFTPNELKDCHFWGACLLPSDVSAAQRVFGKLRLGQSPVKCELFLVTKSGKRRRIAWTFSQLPDVAGEATPYVASGIDITEQHAALESLEQSEVLISNMLSSLKTESPAGQAFDDPPAVAASEDPAPVDEPPVQAPEELPPVPKNRRRTHRKDFPYFQLIGPIHNGRLPTADEYQEVRCRDISPTGFSYIAQVPPNFQELVVSLGAYPSQMYLTAEIIHVNRHREYGQNLVLVGCQYTSRIQL